MPYYDRALEQYERAGDADGAAALGRERQRCSELVQEIAGEPPTLYESLTHQCRSPEERDQVLAHLAAGMAFNIWHFEPRSFAAYCEGAPIVEEPSAAEGARPVRFPIRWPTVLVTFAGIADYENQKGRAAESIRLVEMCAAAARASSLPPGLGVDMLGRSSLQHREPEASG